MIGRIKDLMKIKDEIDAINKNLKENSREVYDLKLGIEELKKTLGDMGSIRQDFIKDFSEELKSIKYLKEDFGKEVYEFRLLKAKMQNRILERFEEELKKELGINNARLQKDLEEYEQSRKKIAQMALAISSAGDEIKKFIEISSNIKKEDFELDRFARQLSNASKEKLDLMRKIDSLERLVSKMRRRDAFRQ